MSGCRSPIADLHFAPVAQLDRASASGAEGWRFESSRGYLPKPRETACFLVVFCIWSELASVVVKTGDNGCKRLISVEALQLFVQLKSEPMLVVSVVPVARHGFASQVAMVGSADSPAVMSINPRWL